MQRRTADWRSMALLAAVLGAALLLRLAVLLKLPSLHHPDENFQFFEQAHRLAFGYGLVPWEFVEGMRSLVVPWLLSRLLLLVGPAAAPELQLLVQRTALALLSLLPVAAVFLWGLQRGRAAALLLGLVAAGWFELVYFAGRPLAEAIAAGLLVAAIALACRADERGERRGFVVVGLLLGLVAMLRIHLAVGVLLVGLALCWGDQRWRWRPLLAGAALPVALFGIADWIAWGWPFHSYVRAIAINLVKGAASAYGVEPWHGYLRHAVRVWGAAVPLLLVLAAWQPRRNALWLLAAAGIVASHSLIPHKEYRFVVPAFACLAMAAAGTTADWLQRFVAGRPLLQRSTAVSAAVVAWLGVSLILATQGPFRREWSGGRAPIEAAFWLHRQPELCGLLQRAPLWSEGGGYAHLGRDVPMYVPFGDELALLAGDGAYNYLIASNTWMRTLPPPFQRVRCFGANAELCVARRPGGCTAAPGLQPLAEQVHRARPHY